MSLKTCFWVLLPCLILLSAFLYAHFPSRRLPEGMTADHLLVEKSARRMTAYFQGQALKSYRIALGWSPAGAKQRQGDGKTPEGQYVIDWRNPNSKFHLSLHISYPDLADVARGEAGGYDPGDNIMIHGVPPGKSWLGRWFLLSNWTVGCISVTNTDMDELWRIIPDGVTISIQP